MDYNKKKNTICVYSSHAGKTSRIINTKTKDDNVFIQLMTNGRICDTICDKNTILMQIDLQIQLRFFM